MITVGMLKDKLKDLPDDTPVLHWENDYSEDDYSGYFELHIIHVGTVDGKKSLLLE